jgi:hypothetical protein
LIYCSKKFLSDRADESGSLICKVESSRLEDLYSDNTHVDAGITLRACYGEPCSIDLSFSSEKSLHRRIAKIDLMIEELGKLRDILPEMWEDAQKVSEEYKVLHADDEPKVRRGIDLLHHHPSDDD